jgi:hypothetical protein
MSVQSTYEKIQTLNRAITGIVTAPTAMPTSLNAAALPCALTIPGPAQWDTQAIGLPRQLRTYAIRVYVLPISQGAGVDEGFQKVLPILQAFGNYYLSQPGQTLGGTVDHIDSIADSGVKGDLTFGGVAYHGFEFTLSVTEKG